MCVQVTVLDKSRSDWKDFKQADDSIEEELEVHKRSGGQVCGGGLAMAALRSKHCSAEQPCACQPALLHGSIP